jgi:carboxylesterase
MTSPPIYLDGAEPFFYRGNQTGVLCLHGLTAAPHEVAWFGQHLAQTHGYTVYGPRLTLHGGDFRDMRRARWQDWYRAAYDGLTVLRAQCQRVAVAGLSLGGLLTLLLGAWHQPDALIVMAAPLSLPDARLLPHARWIKFVRPFFDAQDKTDFPQRLKSTQAQRGERPHGRVRYSRWAGRAAQELHTIMGVADALLPQITAPTLTIYSENDQTVPLFNQTRLTYGLSNAPVQAVTVQQSGHILTQDHDHALVFQHAADFLHTCFG